MSCCEDQNYQSIDPFKRGDLFSLVCTWKEDGVAQSVDSLTIKSQVRRKNGSLVADLVVTKLSDLGKFTLTCSDTEDWHIGTLICDVQITENGITRSSQTFVIPVIEGVTQ